MVDLRTCAPPGDADLKLLVVCLPVLPQEYKWLKSCSPGPPRDDRAGGALLERPARKMNCELPCCESRLNERCVTSPIGSLPPMWTPMCSRSYLPGSPVLPTRMPSRFDVELKPAEPSTADLLKLRLLIAPTVRYAGISYAPGPGVRKRPMLAQSPAAWLKKFQR